MVQIHSSLPIVGRYQPIITIIYNDIIIALSSLLTLINGGINKFPPFYLLIDGKWEKLSIIERVTAKTTIR
tara:strand:- start:727 stop:939 length:213 start_codon:yes stop_codon:yes gene_type:complete